MRTVTLKRILLFGMITLFVFAAVFFFAANVYAEDTDDVFDVTIQPEVEYDGFIFKVKEGVTLILDEDAKIWPVYEPRGIYKADFIEEIKKFVKADDIEYIEPDHLVYAEDSVFTDVPEDAWYYNYVQDAYNNGLVQGTSVTTFSPERDIKRGDFVVMLGRLHEFLLAQDALSGAGIGEISNNYFTDVDADAYYAKYINWAYENNIVSGYENNIFGPEEKLTREQMAVMLYRYLFEFGFIDEADPYEVTAFDDADLQSSWAADAIDFLKQNSIISGYQNQFHPKDYATRAEATKVYIIVISSFIPLERED